MPHTLVIIRDRWKDISPKARFVVQIFRASSKINILYIVRNERKKFTEKWSHDKVELATSISGVLFNLFAYDVEKP